MSGYAVRNDLCGWRAVDGGEADPDDLSKTYPDPDTEYYSEYVPAPPVPSKSELNSSALYKRDELLAVASLKISPLQDAIDLGDSTDSDIESLKKWKQYRIALNRIEQQSTFPMDIAWPVSPE
ncbi:tail fiber assembly protein [Pseudomonas gingeri]